MAPNRSDRAAGGRCGDPGRLRARPGRHGGRPHVAARIRFVARANHSTAERFAVHASANYVADDSLTPYERVACLGDEQLTVEGTFGCPFCDTLTWPFPQEPAWLAQWTHHLSMLVPSWSNYPPFPGSIVVVTPPDVSGIAWEERGSVLRVTGHFDDVRASDCSITPDADSGADAVDDEAAEWYCRERFVVESWEVIGTDPAFAELITG